MKEIFDQPEKPPGRKISEIFTYFKHSAKSTQQEKAKTPSFVKAFPIGVDIGTSSIKMIQLGIVDRDLEIVNMAVVELPLQEQVFLPNLLA